ncbi:MAG TPA: DinB family protein [Gemmatimonadales bacterium]|nr:DinB family protein [Gemmatimonadales bacterium]
MIEHRPWFERKFEFTIPLSQFPNVVERLRGTPVRLAERVARLDPNRLTHRDGDRWSIQENAGHLLDLEPLWLGRVHQLLRGEPTLVAADLTNRKTHEAGHNARPIQEILRGFQAARAELVRLLDEADDAVLARTALHPRLQTPMRLIDLGVFVAEHDDHHLARITQLRRLH